MLTRRGLFGLLGAVAAGAFVEPARVARVFLMPPLRPSASWQLNEATLDYVKRYSLELVDNVFQEFPAIAMFRGVGKTGCIAKGTLVLNPVDTPIWLAKGGWK